MKWEVVEPERGKRDYREADAIVDAAERSGKRVRGHPLLWDQQLPGWLAEGGFEPAELERIVRDHVRDLVSRYKGRVAQWDVVNEPLEEDGSFTKSLFFTTLGERYIDIAIDEAHKADPAAELFLNEIAAERPGPKLTALGALAERLRRRGVPIDGIGFQNHTTVEDAPTKAELQRLMDGFAKLQLSSEITEMDVIVPPNGSLGAQAAAYAAAASACAETASCTGLTVWGVTDRYSWLGADKRPLPFAGDGAPKPAAAALDAALRKPGR